MTVRNVKKNLAAQQDMLPGLGPYNQTRRGVSVTVDGPAKSYIEHWKNYCGSAYVGTFEDGFGASKGKIAVSLTLGKAFVYTGLTAVVVPANSMPGVNWTELEYNVVNIWALETLKRIYAESGYNLVDGSFEAGGVLVASSDVLLHEASGKAYLGPAGTVAAGTDPSSGGFTLVNITVSTVVDYAALRSYTGPSKSVYVTGIAVGTVKPEGISGYFALDATDTTSTDNGGTVIVGAGGRRWKRQYYGIPSVEWWGAKPDGNGTTGTGTDNTVAIQAAHDAEAIIYYPNGSYKTGPITLSKFGATLVGPGELYGRSELIYTGSGTLFTCLASVSYAQFKSGMFLHGIPAVATDYYNTGSIAIDTVAGNTSIVFEGSWISSFEILFNSNYNSYYNRFDGCRLERFRIGLNKFSSNNVQFTRNRVSRFNTAFVANGANGPLVIDKNAFEIFNGPIAAMSGVEQGAIVFTNNYVELYDSVSLPTNFPPSAAPNTTKFGGNILFTGPIGSFKQSGNELQIGGCFRYLSASLNVDVIESVGNNIHMYTSGNNLERLWAAPSVGSVNINDRLGITQGASGGYSRTYAAAAIAQLSPNRPYSFYDCIAGKMLRPAAESTVLTLQNSWTNPDAAHGVARAHKRNGDTRVSGVTDGTANTGITAFTIPAEYRPDEIGTTRAFANFTCFSAYGAGSPVRFKYLYNSGEFRLESGASLAGVLLDGVFIPVRT